MKRFLLIIIIIITAIPIIGLAEQYRVSGSVLVEKVGDLYIYLVDEDQFPIPFTGIQERKIKLEEEKYQKITFSFSGIPEGHYGIRVFVDINYNGKLDRGLFGPSEPWGMSWKGEPKKGIPRFSDIAFQVDRDIEEILIDTRSDR
ncbi:MAG: DUF2141 domain-containing protein [Spirochaetota bacterium]|nr:MAG: DUF2141 domain-containing protein [Spirochaetota bacterium]